MWVQAFTDRSGLSRGLRSVRAMVRGGVAELYVSDGQWDVLCLGQGLVAAMGCGPNPGFCPSQAMGYVLTSGKGPSLAKDS